MTKKPKAAKKGCFADRINAIRKGIRADKEHGIPRHSEPKAKSNNKKSKKHESDDEDSNSNDADDVDHSQSFSDNDDAVASQKEKSESHEDPGSSSENMLNSSDEDNLSEGARQINATLKGKKLLSDQTPIANTTWAQLKK